MSAARYSAVGPTRSITVVGSLLALLASLLVLAPPAPASAEPAQLANACPDPVPPTAFTDASEGPHAAAIRCLVAWDITQGITATRYEPGRTVVRAQMATFLVRLIRAAGSTVPTPATSQFNDVDGVHRDNIEALAALEIAQGTGSARFSPSAEVTRAQMAIFIDRTLSHLGARSPSVSGSPFADVPDGNVAADAIARLSALGVVQGVSEDRYDPGRAVTRAQMASFLMRAADVLVDDGVASVPYLDNGDGVTPPPGEPSPTPDDGDLSRTGFPGSCPALSDSLDEINTATYLIAFTVQQEQDGQQVEIALAAGTGFGVRNRLIATNAHVSDVFREAAAGGLPVSRAIAVQAGTGEVVQLRRAINHPDYDGTANSADVALFTTQEALPATLPLAPATSIMALGDAVQVTGFPGRTLPGPEDMPMFPVGSFVPQASALQGNVNARLAFDQSQVVTRANLSIYQHQAPTEGGVSGSAIMHCGLVAAVHNSGIERTADGQRIPGSLNFGVHVRYLHELIELWDDNVLAGFEVPVPAGSQPGQPGQPGQPDPSGPQPVALVNAQVNQPGAEHQFGFLIRDDASLIGLSQWPNGNEFQLTGQINNQGQFTMQDNSPFNGTYTGTLDPNTGQIQGVYTEPGMPGSSWQFIGQIVSTGPF